MEFLNLIDVFSSNGFFVCNKLIEKIIDVSFGRLKRFFVYMDDFFRFE